MKDCIVNIIGRGTSTKGFDFSQVKGDVIGVNHIPDVGKKVDYVVYWDGGVYDTIKHTDAKIVTIEPQYPNGDIFFKNKGNQVNLNDGEVGNINLSGWVAINVALHLCYEEIYLIGFDGGNGENGDPYRVYNDRDFPKFVGFADIQNVVNPEHDSMIECFPKITYDEYYKRICERVDGCFIVDTDRLLSQGDNRGCAADY